MSLCHYHEGGTFSFLIGRFGPGEGNIYFLVFSIRIRKDSPGGGFVFG